jgi:flavin-dependent dehydrogenase
MVRQAGTKQADETIHKAGQVVAGGTPRRNNKVIFAYNPVSMEFRMIDGVDVAIVGGGPAGSTVAALLAQAGLQVALAEQKPFPRQKVCGEFISNGARPVLERLGLLAEFDSLAGPPLRRVRVLTQTGQSIEAPFPSDIAGAFPRAISRDLFDQLLIARAREWGAHILQPCHVTAIAGSTGAGFLVRTGGGDIRSRCVVVAHGMPASPAVAGRLAPTGADNGFVCFKTHFTGCNLPNDLIAIAGVRDLYAGLAPTSSGPDSYRDRTHPPAAIDCRRYNLAFVARRRLLAHYPDADSLLAYLFRRNAPLLGMIRHARRIDRWHACGPLVPGVRRIFSDGCFFTGNAAGEVHALIGEGITLALRSARLLSDKLVHGLRAGEGFEDIGLAYEAAWRCEFYRRWRAGNLFSELLMRPLLGEVAAAVLEAFPELMTLAVHYSGKTPAAPDRFGGVSNCRTPGND